jgi:hypothetical protein
MSTLRRILRIAYRCARAVLWHLSNELLRALLPW